MSSLKTLFIASLAFTNYGCNSNESIHGVATKESDTTSTDSLKEIKVKTVVQSDSENIAKPSKEKVFHLDLNAPNVSINKELGVKISTETHFKVDSELHCYLPVMIKNISKSTIIGSDLKLGGLATNELRIGKFKFALKPGHAVLLKISSKQLNVNEADILNHKPFFGKVEASSVFYSDGNIASEETKIIVN